ncbi:MAG: HPP family protein [Archangium sp.]
MQSWFRAFLPAPIATDGTERLRAVVGAALGILVTALISHAIAGTISPWMVAPLGASAVLVFAVPASPLAQPWSVIGGNTLSAACGVLCVRLIGVPEYAAGAAVGLAIAVMFTLRCLHPPGGAAALLVALAGVNDPRFVLFPVLTNSVLLVAMGIAWNNATKRRYPHVQLAAKPDAELEAVITKYNQVLDVPRDDLRALLNEVRFRGLISGTKTREVMTKQAISLTTSATTDDARVIFVERHIKAIPVVDAANSVIGIVSPIDLTKPGSLAEVMTTNVKTVDANTRLADLVPMFTASGHHHLPVVEDGKLVGMLTESNVIRALTPAA